VEVIRKSQKKDWQAAAAAGRWTPAHQQQTPTLQKTETTSHAASHQRASTPIQKIEKNNNPITT
jgi:hypothetical protein